MAEKDITEKVLMSHTDVFADCVNALVYGGRRRLRTCSLRTCSLRPRKAFIGKRKGCITSLATRASSG